MGAETPNVVARCRDEIRRMVLKGEFLPGEKVNQGRVAERLGVSRIPVREALGQLRAEGVVDYQANTGFSVARFNARDLVELYLMRRLLETELLRSLDLDSVDVERMVDLNEELRVIVPDDEPARYAQVNRDFHFVLFAGSSYDIVRRVVSNLWDQSELYRAIFVFEREHELHVIEEHESIIAAVRAGNRERLIEVCDVHRSSTEELVVQRLASSGRG